jgi:hypothetical protein
MATSRIRAVSIIILLTDNSKSKEEWPPEARHLQVLQKHQLVYYNTDYYQIGSSRVHAGEKFVPNMRLSSFGTNR